MTDRCSEKSPTNVAAHFSFSELSSPSLGKTLGGLTRHILTCPSREPVAIRWYDLPHEGAHETDVMAYVTGGSVSPLESDDGLGAKGSSVNRV